MPMYYAQNFILCYKLSYFILRYALTMSHVISFRGAIWSFHEWIRYTEQTASLMTIFQKLSHLNCQGENLGIISVGLVFTSLPGHFAVLYVPNVNVIKGIEKT